MVTKGPHFISSSRDAPTQTSAGPTLGLSKVSETAQSPNRLGVKTLRRLWRVLELRSQDDHRVFIATSFVHHAQQASHKVVRERHVLVVACV